MRKISILSIFILASLLSLIYSSKSFSQAHIVEAVGRAAIVNNNIELARDAALKDAFSKAVEQALGVFIDSKAYIVNEKLLHSSVLAKAKGHVKKYDLLIDEPRRDIYLVKIRAEVKKGVLIKSVRNVIEKESMLLLVYNSETEMPEDGIVTSKMNEVLTGSGYKVIDFFYDKSTGRLELFKQFQVSPEKVLRDLELKFIVKNVLIGKVSDDFKGRFDLDGNADPEGKLYLSVANGIFTLLRISDNQAVIEKVFEEIKGFGNSRKDAKKNVYSKLADESSKRFLESLDDYYNVKNRNITLKLQGLKTRSDFNNFKRFLGQVRWVRKIKKADYSSVLSIFEVLYAFKPEFFAQSLEAGYPLRIVETTGYEITANIARDGKIQKSLLDKKEEPFTEKQSSGFNYLIPVVLAGILFFIWLSFKIRRAK